MKHQSPDSLRYFLAILLHLGAVHSTLRVIYVSYVSVRISGIRECKDSNLPIPHYYSRLCEVNEVQSVQ